MCLSAAPAPPEPPRHESAGAHHAQFRRGSIVYLSHCDFGRAASRVTADHAPSMIEADARRPQCRPVRSDLDFAMPFSNILHLNFLDKIRATRLAGFQQMTIQPQEVLKLVAEGLPIADMKSIAADGGVAIGRLDPLCPWVPDWKPTNFGTDYAAAHDISPRTFFDLCDKLGCKFMSLNATFPATRDKTAEITEFYAAICRQAAEHGVICDLECIPMWGVVTLEQGLDVLKDFWRRKWRVRFRLHALHSWRHIVVDPENDTRPSHTLRSGLRRLSSAAARGDPREGVF